MGIANRDRAVRGLRPSGSRFGDSRSGG